MDGRSRLVRGNYKTRRNAIDLCALVAASQGYKMFAVQDGGWCATGPRAHVTFNRYGKSNRCRNGKGGPWANDVYRVSGECVKFLGSCGCSSSSSYCKIPQKAFPRGSIPLPPSVLLPSLPHTQTHADFELCSWNRCIFLAFDYKLPIVKLSWYFVLQYRDDWKQIISRRNLLFVFCLLLLLCLSLSLKVLLLSSIFLKYTYKVLSNPYQNTKPLLSASDMFSTACNRISVNFFFLNFKNSF